MELWERSQPLAELEDLLRQGGRVALVAGEAGIGKSSLVSAFGDRCAARARFLLGVCDPLVTPRALGPLHDIGRQVGGALADRLRAGADRGEVLAALLDELSGPRQRLRPVVVVEDAHWADEATMDLLVFLSRRIGRLPALLLVTYRDDEVGPEHPLRAALAAMPAAVVRRVAMAPLSPECVAGHAVGRDAAEVYRLTGGNPLLVTEILANDGPAVPDTVRDLVLARLRGLPAPARAVAHLVSVVPTRAEPAVLRGHEEDVERCVAAGVLVPSGDGVAYRHELLRRAVDWDGALDDARASLDRPGGPGVAVVPALVARGRILSARGDDTALSTMDDAATTAYGLGEVQWVGPVASARAEHFLLLGDPERALAEARPGWDLASAKEHRWLVAELAFRRWRAGAADARPGGPHGQLIDGDWAGAAAAWATRGRQYARLEALAYGDRAAATEALTGLDRVGAVRAVTRLRAELRRRGVTGVPRGPRPATVAHPAGLTARQAEVLRLLAAGLSTMDIAARLTLSPKTVEHHVSAVLDKLGTASRGRAVAAVLAATHAVPDDAYEALDPALRRALAEPG